MIALILAALLAQPDEDYLRSRTTDAGDSNCLYWPEKSVIEFRQNGHGNEDTPADTEFTAITRAFQTWNTQMDTCGSLSFQEGPRTYDRNIGSDDHNLIVFRIRRCLDVISPTDSCWKADTCSNIHDCWPYSDQALAITTTTYRPNSGQIIDADIEFNSDNFLFTTVDAPPCVRPNFHVGCVASDVQNTATHEIGHMLGLAHTGRVGSTMNPNANPGETEKRTLDPGTQRFVCDTYPAGQPSQACSLKAFGSSEAYTQQLGKVPRCTCGAGGLQPLWGLVLLLLARRRPAA